MHLRLTAGQIRSELSAGRMCRGLRLQTHVDQAHTRVLFFFLLFAPRLYFQQQFYARNLLGVALEQSRGLETSQPGRLFLSVEARFRFAVRPRAE